ncbi:MAG: N-acetylmuramoyl-L-alanine amidase, partial [Bacillota bacterium]|nr:N-acetylmuramoyl-L-alanine amidase [Bacillota bacterium]
MRKSVLVLVSFFLWAAVGWGSTAEAASWIQVSGPIAPGLKEGMAGPAVRTLQGDLWHVGLNPGPVDGFFGARTRAALETFQRQEGLAVTGTLTQGTFARLVEKVLGQGSLSGVKILLDPGHGDGTGAWGVYPGAKDEHLNVFQIALRAKALLEGAGAQVILTRKDGQDSYYGALKGLEARVAMANDLGATLFISLHQNWNPDAGIRGLSTYYWTADSRGLAQAVQREVARATGLRAIGLFT